MTKILLPTIHEIVSGISRHITFLMLFFSGINAVQAAAPVAITLATERKALLPVVVSANATEPTKANAAELADYLGRISGAKFEIKTGDGSSGIVVGLARDFPALVSDPSLTSKAITERENFLLRSHSQGVLVLGNAESGVSHAVWEFLHKLGHRQFFPGATWEIIPQRAELTANVDVLEKPSFHQRYIWYGWGTLPERQSGYDEWCVRNRAIRGIELQSGHAYQAVLHDHEADFAAHPEYFALVDGKRRGPKFCTANADLRALVVRHQVALLDANPSLDAVSCEPSDGTGWCECAGCAKLGSISDQALFLSNDLARTVQAKHPGKFVGQLAYSLHSAVPTIQAEPNVVISIATAFIKGGESMDQLLDGWSQHARTLGIREYLDLPSQAHDLPAISRGANLDLLCETIPQFHAKGARFYSAESSDNWGCNGLGYYLAARLLWDVREAAHLDAIVEDFIVNCFPASQKSMRKFYQLINRGKPPTSDDLVGRMYRLLHEARGLARDDAERKRLDELVLYTHHVELWMDYTAATGSARQAGMEAVLRHSSRIGSTGMVHTLGLWGERWRGHDKEIKLPEEYRYAKRGENPWRSTASFSADEIDSFVEQGIANRAVAAFEPVNFSRDLVPATALALKGELSGDAELMQRGPRHYWTWIDRAPATIEFEVTAGIVFANRGAAKIALYPINEPQGKAVASAEATPDKQTHIIRMQTKFPGLHRIEVTDGKGGTRIVPPAGHAFTLACDFAENADTPGKRDLHFYVPRGTKVVGGFAKGAGRMLNGSGKVVHQFAAKPGYFSVAVPEGEDAALWQFANTGGQRVLLTVPPYLARSAAELLLPREVVDKDTAPR